MNVEEIRATMSRWKKRRSLFRFPHSLVLRHSYFNIFSRLVLVLLLALSLSCSSKRITKANVDQITDGMSKKQVESILGAPTSLNTDDFVIMKKTTYVYRQGKDTVTITFKDDKVQAKDSTLSN
jgi:outer membrane protein assembly factor BamE (lipoprotein component of BamABCDE complex)